MSLPVLYSFRRCPYAIRARMAMVASGIQAELREVKLSNMPPCMLAYSPKATVPVLVLESGEVIDESLDVMTWSLGQSDPDGWLNIDADARDLVRRSDEDFKPLLDAYKYADRHPEASELEHRQRAETFVAELDRRLSEQPWLSGDQCRFADIAIFPFVRQFAGVEPAWFGACDYVALREWLNGLLASERFLQVMGKRPFWKAGDAVSLLF